MRYWVYYVKSKYLLMTIWSLLMFSLYSVYFLHAKLRMADMSTKHIRALPGGQQGMIVPRPAVFEPNKPKAVILLSYQRCGSSFTGQLFNQNPEMLYVFEPVDSIYHAMYGTQHGYTVPSDIYYFWNGTRRTIPEYEKNNIVNSLESFLNCDMDKIPQEMLNHKFMDSGDAFFGKSTKSLDPYIQCLKDKERCNCDPPFQRCAKSIKHTCNVNFGENHYRHLKCYDALWNNMADMEYFTNSEVDTFYEYNICMKRINDSMQHHCVPILKQMCSKSKVHALKTVRLTMESASELIERMPNLRVIHLIRDPRGVVLSRRREGSYHGHYSGSNMAKEAELYCNQVLEDVKTRQSIEKRFPGSTMQLVYEEYSSNPLKYAKEMYSFMNETLPAVVEGWLFNNTRGIIKDSQAIAVKWQTKLSFILSKNISEVCSKFYNTIEYNWP